MQDMLRVRTDESRCHCLCKDGIKVISCIYPNHNYITTKEEWIVEPHKKMIYREFTCSSCFMEGANIYIEENRQ